MTRRTLPPALSVIVLPAVLLATGLFPLPGGEGKPANKPAAPADKAAGADVLAEVKAWNSDRYAGPPAEFRQGHVTPRKLDDKAVRQTEGGFVIQLPGKAPVPTPSVYRGRVYVSGGFHSK